jgi:hypothetical protein
MKQRLEATCRTIVNQEQDHAQFRIESIKASKEELAEMMPMIYGMSATLATFGSIGIATSSNTFGSFIGGAMIASGTGLVTAYHYGQHLKSNQIRSYE